MRTIYRQSIYTALTLFIVAVTTAVGTLAQGRHDRGGGPPPGRGEGGQRQVFNPGPQRQMPRPMPQQMQRQQPRFERPQMERQQPRFERPQVARPQPQPRYTPAPMQRPMQRPQPQANRGWQNRGWQIPGGFRPERSRPQPQRTDTPQPQFRIERRAETRMPSFRQDRIERRPDLGRMPERQMRADRGNGEWMNGRHRDDGNIPAGRMREPRQWNMENRGNRAWPNNYGFRRSSEAHFRNAERRELREQEGIWRARARDEGRRFDERDFQRAYYRHRDYRDNVLRSVVANVFIGNTDNYYYTPQYHDTYSYRAPYDPGYYSDTSYSNYQPSFGYFYTPGYFVGDPLYSYDSYLYANDPDLYADDFPLSYYTDPYSSNVYVTQMYGDLLAYGYEEGYEDGLYASNHRRYRDSYDDPFTLEDTVYDPYSYSLGENRRCLSEGYELGYQDALAGYDDYDPNYSEGNVDLVSLFIGTQVQYN